MNGQKVYYRPVDLVMHSEFALEFRRDVFLNSHGNLDGFSDEDTKLWHKKIAAGPDYYFLHVYLEDKIIGQLEFRTNIEISDGRKGGYINLIYLTYENRGLGMGQLIHDFTTKTLKDDGVEVIRLKCAEKNRTAEQFYLKNGWSKIGDSIDDLLLMEMN